MILSALRYEWRRLISVRATWVLLAVSIAFAVLFAVLQVTLPELSAGIDGRSPIDMVLDAAHNPISATLIAAVAAMSFGHEYRYGVIRVTLTALPRRGMVFASKAIMAGAFAAVAYALNLLASYGVALIAGSDRVRFRSPSTRQSTSPDTDLGTWSSLIWQDWVRSAAYIVIYALIAFAITALVRNLALGVIIPLIASTILESLLMGFLDTRLLWLNDVMPYTNGSMFLEWTAVGDAVTSSGALADPMAIDYATANPITPVRAGAVYAAWAAMLMAGAYALFERRDA